ncbi:hypothetical protein HOLleu_05138 [Holothuria leucospilota]|uniref:Uncharacterized protein n=1 Tax=Holothuria leucospilota TaxID=206669 RepID=A0A9Q1CKY7_HOLLE|nr:hypothetical protein HOLleu_05138 [Holothuria leucospilota]
MTALRQRQLRTLFGQYDTLMVELAQECGGDYVKFKFLEPALGPLVGVQWRSPRTL